MGHRGTGKFKLSVDFPLKRTPAQATSKLNGLGISQMHCARFSILCPPVLLPSAEGPEFPRSQFGCKTSPAPSIVQTGSLRNAVGLPQEKDPFWGHSGYLPISRTDQSWIEVEMYPTRNQIKCFRPSEHLFIVLGVIFVCVLWIQTAGIIFTCDPILK